MAYKVFLDANVILEYFMKRKSLEDSRKIMIQLEDGAIKGFTSNSIVQTCGYILIKSYGNTVARNILLGMLKFITVIDCKHETVILALNSIIRDPEDAIQYYSAIQHHMDYYITFDQELITQSTPNLPIMAPKDFLKL
jgi:predicted nucleic acid-binding protein